MSSPTDLPSVPAIQTPQSQINGHDSTDHPQPPHDAETQPPPQDDAVSGDKRKRDVEEEEGGDNKTKQHPLWKTSLCSFFRRQDASCGHGAGCRYAHSEAELRPRPDNTWDPTSERAKKASCEEEKECAAIDDVMMTEALEDDDEDGEGDGFGSDPALSKCLVHLPRNWKSDKLKEFLSEQGIQYKSAKKKKGMALGFMSFESAEQLETAVKALDGISIGNNNIKVADVLPRSFEKKTKSALGLPLIGESGEDSMVANGVEDGDGMKGRSARTVVTPLAHMPYADQLEQKKSSVTQILKKLTRNARKACPNGVPLPEWILKSREIGGLPCILEGILASPVVNGYRNKCEFSVGHSLQGKVTVGFMLGNFREGVTAVEEPLDCPNVSAISCKFASIFQEFLQQSSLPVWNRFKNNGFWRQLTVREGRSGSVSDAENCELNMSEILLMVQVSIAGFDNSLVTSEFERLAQAFSAGATENSPSLPLTAFVIQDHQGISNVAPADAPLHSLCISKAENGSEIQATNNMTEPKIHDYISNLRFCISPTAFFQVNTLAAEKLYSLAGDWAELGPHTLLFDVCCGTGTIGLTLAHRVGMVVGIEMNASAVLDAQRNAEINGIKNCRFVCSKAEDVMRSLLEEYLTVPEKQVTNAIEGSDKAIVTDEKKIVATDEEIIKDEKPNPEESSSHEPENGKTASDSIENGMHELQQSCSSEKNKSPVRCFKNIVAIVDPPRSGLHPTVIKALRTHSGLRRLVYISCNPETLVANAIELCTPSPDKIEKNKNNRAWRNMSSAGLARHRAKSMPASEPFRPVKAMAVDLFPHTVHCELVMLLER
ncbi:PREDICTED: zinc finger CCCH domain-containing protein 24 [Fragaria vesca subsp. vesca]|uniref:zinc finger CCCH domain-containing protein 24 n=1 Tax=Fragaria vesca subsp. vesca TaxID=101020 RepID=UPI0002C2F445|nr:PREDICTED: zinc finger CCCH domain-containing protein 24 [Fragaria vesca subsp. vesca]